MEIDSVSAKDGDEMKPKALVVLLMGAPGSGKSTFCDKVMGTSSRPWVRICQDIINKGKSGTKAQCLTSATNALKDGKSIFIDRCNLDREQRAEFVKLGSSQVDVNAVVLDLPAKLCISRSIKRTGHEGNLQGGKAAAVVNRMLQKKELPKLDEGYSRITLCHNDKDVQDAIEKYSALGPSDILPSGCFGQRSQDAKAQVGIMKFFKKLDGPGTSNSDAGKIKGSCPNGLENDQNRSGQVAHSIPVPVPNKEFSRGDDMMTDSVGVDTSPGEDCGGLPSPDEVPTLAFPSISTADFKFDLEKASDIIVQCVQEWLTKTGRARMALVDLTHRSKILSLVKAKAAQKDIDSSRFFTFVGDITQLYSEGGLRCSVIANATNWRLKPGGGGVNAAIFNAAGPSLKTATEQRAGSLLPGKAVVVPLPSTSPLFSKEGVTHVIHVLGPNMNPQRPNCLDNYDEGCKVLRRAYRSLFEGFTSIVSNQSISSKQNSGKVEEQPSHLCALNDGKQENHSPFDQKTKRENDYEVERNKKSKGNSDAGGGEVHGHKADSNTAVQKWGSWAQSLYNIAMHPEKHEKDVLEIMSDVVVLSDLYPKAKKHILVLSRYNGLDSLKNVHQEHLQLLRTMHEVGVKWAENFIEDDPSLIFRMGYHSVPSMRQLHLHVISQDFDSASLKNKKHWNSFTTTFFRDSVDVINEVADHGKVSLKDDESILSMELRCHRCKSAHPNIPRLKSHIKNCQAHFPQALLEDKRLIGKLS